MVRLPDWFITLGTVTLTVIMVAFLLLCLVVCLWILFMAIKDILARLEKKRRLRD